MTPAEAAAMAELTPAVARWTVRQIVEATFVSWKAYHVLHGFKHAPPWHGPIRIRRAEVRITKGGR